MGVRRRWLLNSFPGLVRGVAPWLWKAIYWPQQPSSVVWIGWFLIASGIFHGLVQWVDPRPWESAIGWRKPILFGVSTGLTLLSVAWVVERSRLLEEWKKGWLWLGGMAWAALIEVGLITIQTWRGVPAHFNLSTPWDKALGFLVDGLLVYITGVLVLVWWKILRQDGAGGNGLSRDYRRAALDGMTLLLLGCGLGFWVAIRGILAAAGGEDPSVIGPAGVPKFPHGMPLHAIQYLPFWVAGLRVLVVASRSWSWLPRPGVRVRARSVRFLALAIFASTVYAFYQAVSGRGRFDPDTPALGMLLVTVGFVVLSIAVVIRETSYGDGRKSSRYGE